MLLFFVLFKLFLNVLRSVDKILRFSRSNERFCSVLSSGNVNCVVQGGSSIVVLG